MAQRKTKPHLSMAKVGEKIEENGEGVGPRKSVEPSDHWGFLDEIEAPMWADLNLEASSGYKENDDDWFEISHPFHQCSARQLKYVFSRVGEGNGNMDLGIQETSSPKLPPSVSRSRGKQYISREWGQTNREVASNNQHPVKNLSSKSSLVNLGSTQNIKTKPSNGYRKGNARSKANLVCESSITETSGPSYPKPSSIVEIKEVESKSVSTITCESSENKHQKLLEVSSHTVSHTSGLLSALKITLRKSCVTRQASRVEIVGGRQSEGRKSSSGKSSVGSSSHPRYDVRNVTHPASQNKDVTPDSRNVMRAPQATKDKAKVSNMLKEPTAKNRILTSKSRGGYKTNAAAKAVHLETVKSKVVHSKPMRQRGVNEKDSAMIATKVDGKVGANKYNRPGSGKENNAMNQRSNTRAGSMVQVQKVTKQIAPQKSDRTGLIVPKGKISGRSEVKSSTNVIQKVYFR